MCQDYRWRTTIAYCVIAFFRSAVQKMTGPAMVPIARQVGVAEDDLGRLGFATMAQGLGYVLGAAVAGPLVDRFPGQQHRIVTCAVLIEAASTMLIPLATTLPTVAALLFSDGIGNGAMLPALTVSLVWMWGRDVAPKMQLFSAMFLGTVFSTSLVGLDLELTTAASPTGQGDYRHAFWSISLGQLLFCALPLLFMTPPRRPGSVAAKGEEEKQGLVHSPGAGDSDDEEDKAPAGAASEKPHGQTAGTGAAEVSTADRRRSHVVVAHAGLIVFCYCSAEAMIGVWLATFVFYNGLATEPVAALFVSAFWGGLVASRFAAIWAAGRWSGETLLWMCFTLMGASMAVGFVVAPAVWPGSPPSWILWAATALYGFGCGPVFGACNSLPAQHGVAVTGTQMTLLQLGVSGGNTVGPFLASRLFEVEAIGGISCLPYVVIAAVVTGLMAILSLTSRRSSLVLDGGADRRVN